MVIEGDDEAVLLKDGNKGIWAYDATLGMVPAYEGFSSGKTVLSKAEKWLEIYLELA